MGERSPTWAESAEENFIVRRVCPGCRSGEYEILYRHSFTEPPIRNFVDQYHWDDVDGAFYILAECRRCTLIYQQEVPSPALMQRLYDGPRGQKAKGGPSLARRYRHAYEIIRVIRHLDQPPEKLKVLDFGMGWGEWVSVAQGLGCDSYGFDISERRSSSATKARLQVIGPEDLKRHRFNFINTEQVFEHLSSPLETLVELRDILEPKGIIKISVPNGRGMKRALNKIDRIKERDIKPVLPLFHINCFTRTSILHMANVAGMEERFPPLVRLNRRDIRASPVATFYRRIRHGMKSGTYLFLSHKT